MKEREERSRRKAVRKVGGRLKRERERRGKLGNWEMEYEGKESEGLKEVGKKVLSVLVSFLKYKCVVQLKFSNSLIIHQAKIKEITTVEEV